MLAGKVIRKHVAIIHAYSMMSALQRKIVNVLLYEAFSEHNRINSEESVAVECRISFAKLSKDINFNSNNTKYLKEAIDGLASLKIEWNLLKDKVPSDISFLNLRILHGSPTFYQDGTFNYSFHKVMLDLSNNPEIYGTVDMEVQSQFESKYGHALYENSTRFVNLQKGKIVQLDTFRKMLGVDSDKYETMRELNRNVINPALEEVNDRANFKVDISGIKVGRKITGYELIVVPKKKTESNAIFSHSKVTNELLHKEIKDTFGITSDLTLNNIFSNYTDDYIFEKIGYTKKVAKKDTNGLFPIAYFISALKNDYKYAEPLSTKNNSEDQISKDFKIWNHTANSLQADINHWKKILMMSPSPSIEGILSDSEEKLKQHFLNKPPINQEAT